ncbi:MAG: AMP-binding protein [Acidimicrobiales bacterium]
MADATSGSAPATRGAGPWRSGEGAGWAPYPDGWVERSIAARFAHVAAERPDHEALRSPAGAWTFRELLDDAVAVAERLGDAAGAQGAVGRPVALLARHDGPLVVGVLGALLAGAVVVVLDPEAPEAHRDEVLGEADVAAVLHDADLASVAGAVAVAQGVAAVELGKGPGALAGAGTRPEDLPGVATDHEHPAMLAFTSGTSGTPKGAIITNGVLANLVRGATDALGIGPDDRMPMLFPVSLAVAAYPMFLPLLNGGTLATLDVRSVGLAPVADFLASERITLAYMAPTVVRFLVDALAGRSFPDLRLIALGGELVDAEVVALTRDLLGPTHIANGFGTTETGVITLWVQGADDPVEGAVPAGLPVPEVDLRVLDDHGAPVAAGESGEIAVASPHLFTGYWGHPDLTAQVLLEDPDGRPGWRLYRTGDLGRLDADGVLTVLGRLDTKVKVRGRFVVLGDVEAALHEQPDVVDAVVVPHQRGGTTELAAVLATDGDVDPQLVRSRLLAEQEAYRVPTTWVVVDALPRLPNGKLDRRAASDLVAPLPLGEAPDAPAPRGPAPDRRLGDTPTEREVWELFRLLLPAPEIGLDDDFEVLGGHSLVAAQLLVMIEERSGTVVPMSTMVDSRTVRSLAARIDELRSATGEPSTAAVVQRGDEANRPRLWFVHDLPGSAYRVRHLARHLGPDQPVWSFESPFLRGEPNTYPHLDAFVARYVRDMVAAQPEGPYWLGGYSFGGICAYEMARQLVAAGHEVAFVGVVDVGPSYRGPNWKGRHSPPWPYFGMPQPPPPDAGLSASAQHYLAMAREHPKGFLRHWSIRTGASRPVDQLRFDADLRAHGRVRPEWRLWYAWEEHWKLASKAWDRTYRYDGPVHLFWASLTGSVDGTLGWGPLVDDLHIHHFDGFHDDLLEPAGAPGLAAALRPVLDAELTSP